MLKECWRITLCGGLSARLGARRISRFRTQSTGLLLAYLALRTDQVHGREELAELFWPQSEQPLHSLSMGLSSLRSQLEPPGVGRGAVLATTRSHVSLAPGTVRSDVSDFRESLARAQQMQEGSARIAGLRAAVGSVSGPLLPGSYLDWVLAERDALDAEVRFAFTELACAEQHEGMLEPALHTALRHARLYPTDENAHLMALQLMVGLNRPGDASRHYAQVTALLKAEVGAEPSEMLRVFAAENLTSSKPAPAPASPPVRMGARETLPEDSVRPLRSPYPEYYLPLPLTPFFGREEELARLRALLSPPIPRRLGAGSEQPGLTTPRRRLITVLGMGGAGKTRLGIEAARSLAAGGAQACFVSLADSFTRDQVWQTIFEAVCPGSPEGYEPSEAVRARLASAPALLILDNMEQVVEQGAPVVRALLRLLPELTILVTSRQPLGLEGERELLLEPLPAPPASSPEVLAGFASVQLYVERAQAARSDFQITPRNAESIAALCRKLDGLPLALELAASWAQTLSPQQTLSKLERRFELLRARRGGAPARHRALDACIEWSFSLLSPATQAIFCRLCLLRGEWTVETAAAMSEDGALFEAISRLRAASFLQTCELPEADATVVRFRMLDTLREFGLEQLTPAQIDAGYAMLVTDLIDRADGYPVPIVDRDNMRAAVHWCRTSPAGSSLELSLVNALMHYWANRGGWAEGRDWARDALRRHGGDSTPAGRKAWNTLGFLHAMLKENPEATACFEQAFVRSQQAGDPATAIRALNNIAVMAIEAADYERACTLTRQSLELARTLGDERLITNLLNNVGSAHGEGGHFALASAYFTESLQRCREQGLEGAEAMCLSNLASMRDKMGDGAGARALYEQSLAIFRRVGEEPRIAETLGHLAKVLDEQFEHGLAARYRGEKQEILDRLSGD